MGRCAVWWRIFVLPSWRWLVIAPLALLGAFQAIREELPATSQSKFQLPDIMPNWPWWIWVIIILVVVIFIILESAYRIIQKGRNIEKIVNSFAELVREAGGLRITHVNSSTPELDMICKEAITWTMKAIADISARVGITAEKQIRSELELPLKGEIKEGDFHTPYSSKYWEHDFALVRDRCYEVRNWMQSFIRDIPLNSDK